MNSIVSVNFAPLHSQITIASEIPFEKIIKISSDQYSALQIQKISVAFKRSVGFSTLAGYNDSFFHIRENDDSKISIIRYKLDQSVNSYNFTDYSCLLKWFDKHPFSSNEKVNFEVPFNTACLLSPVQVVSLQISNQNCIYPDPKRRTYCLGRSELATYPNSVFEIFSFCFDCFLVIRRLEHNNLPLIHAKTIDELMPFNNNFRIEDIKKIGDKILGLRHITGRDQADRECKHGMWEGCSLNISFGSAEPGNEAPYFQLHTKTDEEIESLLPLYNLGIENFIKNSIFFDINYSSSIRELLKTVEKTCFLIVHYLPTAMVADCHAWGMWHGRFPKTDVTGDKIVMLKPIDGKVLAISGNADSEKIIGLLVALYKKSVLNYIRTL